MTIPLWRRFAIALITLAVAGVVFRGQLACALITRGDDTLRSGDRSGAVRYYRRALNIDTHSTVAADRLAFYLDMRRSNADARAAIDVTSSALAQSPRNGALLADRAWAEQHLQRLTLAQHDFARAADAANDPRYDHLAARIALMRGRSAEARHYFALALLRDARFDPARAALAGLR